MKFYKTLSAACLGMALTVAAAPAAADDMDVLGQFLEQNFPTQNDPMEAFALSHAQKIEAQAMMAGPLLSISTLIAFAHGEIESWIRYSSFLHSVIF